MGKLFGAQYDQSEEDRFCCPSDGGGGGCHEYAGIAYCRHAEEGDVRIRFKLLKRDGYEKGKPLIDRLLAYLSAGMPGYEFMREDRPPSNAYYRGIQFKMIIEAAGREWEIADGGFVDWTQQLLEDRKERLLIAGFGLDLLFRMQHDKW